MDKIEEWKPVAFALKSLSLTEQRYAQIEKKLLAISFACTRLHQYVYGKLFCVDTNHKPLIALISKDLNKCPQRIMFSL